MKTVSSYFFGSFQLLFAFYPEEDGSLSNTKPQLIQWLHDSLSLMRAMVLFDDLDGHYGVEKKHGGQPVLIARALGRILKKRSPNIGLWFVRRR